MILSEIAKEYNCSLVLAFEIALLTSMSIDRKNKNLPPDPWLEYRFHELKLKLEKK